MRAQAIRRAKSGMLDDDVLQQLISERFEEDPSFWTGTGKSRTVVSVEVDDGIVTLTGVVRTASDKRRADLLARALGASGVDNRLRLAETAAPASPKPRRVA